MSIGDIPLTPAGFTKSGVMVGFRPDGKIVPMDPSRPIPESDLYAKYENPVRHTIEVYSSSVGPGYAERMGEFTIGNPFDAIKPPPGVSPDSRVAAFKFDWSPKPAMEKGITTLKIEHSAQPFAGCPLAPAAQGEIEGVLPGYGPPTQDQLNGLSEYVDALLAHDFERFSGLNSRAKVPKISSKWVWQPEYFRPNNEVVTTGELVDVKGVHWNGEQWWLYLTGPRGDTWTDLDAFYEAIGTNFDERTKTRIEVNRVKRAQREAAKAAGDAEMKAAEGYLDSMAAMMKKTQEDNERAAQGGYIPPMDPNFNGNLMRKVSGGKYEMSYDGGKTWWPAL